MMLFHRLKHVWCSFLIFAGWFSGVSCHSFTLVDWVHPNLLCEGRTFGLQMRDRLSHPAEGLCTMQISSSFTALLMHSIISAGSRSMWPVSQWKSALWTSWWYVVTEVRPDNRVSLSVTTWYTQSEREGSKVIHSFHLLQTFYLFTTFSRAPNSKWWTEWIQIKRFFQRTDFFHLFPPERIVWGWHSVFFFFNMACWLPSAFVDLVCPPGCFRKLPLSAHLELISLIKEWLYRKEFLKLYSNSELQDWLFQPEDKFLKH